MVRCAEAASGGGWGIGRRGDRDDASVVVVGTDGQLVLWVEAGSGERRAWRVVESGGEFGAGESVRVESVCEE